MFTPTTHIQRWVVFLHQIHSCSEEWCFYTNRDQWYFHNKYTRKKNSYIFTPNTLMLRTVVYMLHQLDLYIDDFCFYNNLFLHQPQRIVIFLPQLRSLIEDIPCQQWGEVSVWHVFGLLLGSHWLDTAERYQRVSFLLPAISRARLDGNTVRSIIHHTNRDSAVDDACACSYINYMIQTACKNYKQLCVETAEMSIAGQPCKPFEWHERCIDTYPIQMEGTQKRWVDCCMYSLQP